MFNIEISKGISTPKNSTVGKYSTFISYVGWFTADLTNVFPECATLGIFPRKNINSPGTEL